MSVLDAFFNKGFKGAKCKTLLKLTIPRIKLLRNRREIQIRQMRRDIAKLLETGQEATARIRVEHIIREENMMAAQEILELFCELIAVRLPIIETQRECPLDLKEAISSVCFAAPRCADLPELLQVQILFGAKYGKEFISAATELMPDCGVNRQIIELLSVRAPPAEVKLKLLKEIAEEHELDWDPAASETEFFKRPEDLLNGSTHLMNQSELPLPKEKHDETVYYATAEASDEKSDSDSELDSLGLPEVPKASLRPISGSSAFETTSPQAPPTTEFDHEPREHSVVKEDISNTSSMKSEESTPEQFVGPPHEPPFTSISEREDIKQFPPSLSSPTLPFAPSNPRSKTKCEHDEDLQDVIAAAHAAAESAERAATNARTAARLAEVKIAELMKKNHDNTADSNERPLYSPKLDESATAGTPVFDPFDSTGTPLFDHQNSFNSSLNLGPETLSPSYDIPRTELESPSPDIQVPKDESTNHEPQRLPSMEDDPYFAYPNIFTAQDPNQSSVNSVHKFYL